MRFSFALIPSILCAGLALSVSCSRLSSQEPTAEISSASPLPDAPSPQVAVAPPADGDQQASAAAATTQPESTPTAASGAQAQATSTPASGSAGSAQPSSSSQTSAALTTDDEKTKHDLAEQQLKEQEKQRVFGVMATFNTTRNKDALPLSSGQKYRLFFKGATDPWAFGLTAVVSGIGQARGDEPTWGQGMQGYAKKYGANYSDYFIGNFFGNAVLTSLFHEDPRYFQKGTGSPTSRVLWAASSTVWCKRDNGGWGPNWANVLGNFIGSAISRAYYPPSDRTVGDTLADGATVSAEGIVGAEVIEFWPDMVRHYRRKKAEKLARQAAHSGATSVSPAP